jgi:energy-coupling factor transport system permease protein
MLLCLIVVVTAYVVAARRPATPWSRSYVVFLRIGLAAIAIRMVLFTLLGTGAGTHELFTLPEVPLPGWLAGVRLGGTVSLDGTLAALYDGLRLAVILVCVGAANTLTSPRRLLKSLPSALQEAGVAVTVALTFAPQAVASVGRLRAARRLRGRADKGPRSLRGLAVPVLEGALDRSVDLAAAMDARGFGRRGRTPVALRRATSVLVLGGLLVMAASSYALVDDAAPSLLGLPLLTAGALGCAAGLVLGARAGGRTRYRPNPWRLPEWLVVAAGIVAAVGTVVAPAADLFPATSPPATPALPLLPAAALLVALLPAVVAPPLPRPRSVRPVEQPAPRRRPAEVAS